MNRPDRGVGPLTRETSDLGGVLTSVNVEQTSLDAGIHAELGPKMESLVDHTGDPQTDFELLPEVNAR
jgi:hypothetical protein